MYRLLFFVLLIVLFQASCVSHSQLLNFRSDSDFVPIEDHKILNDVRITIQKDDILYITIRSEEQELAEPFNLIKSSSTGASGSEDMISLQGYLVDTKGIIDFPVLGSIKVGGLTVEEVKELLASLLKKYLIDPIITIRFINFKVTVLGEVNAPKSISIEGERITILEAIGQAGDLKPYSNREQIMVLREQDGSREFGYVNIQSPEVFQSPYYYLSKMTSFMWSL